LGNLYPKDALLALQVDEIIDALEDFQGSIGATMSLGEEAKKEKRLEIVNTSGPKFLTNLEKVLERNGIKENTYVAGKNITIADIKLYYAVSWIKSGTLDHIPATFTDSHPLITAHYNAVKPHIPA